jgi:hypothetical protein
MYNGSTVICAKTHVFASSTSASGTTTICSSCTVPATKYRFDVLNIPSVITHLATPCVTLLVTFPPYSLIRFSPVCPLGLRLACFFISCALDVQPGVVDGHPAWQHDLPLPEGQALVLVLLALVQRLHPSDSLHHVPERLTTGVRSGAVDVDDGFLAATQWISSSLLRAGVRESLGASSTFSSHPTNFCVDARLGVHPELLRKRHLVVAYGRSAKESNEKLGSERSPPKAVPRAKERRLCRLSKVWVTFF